MPSTNGHGPRRAVLYARVSTDEQARSGYSLAQQLEALRAYCEHEGYEVLEEVQDPGQSGAYLERPGLDRVRDLVEAGGVTAVLAQDADRITRDPAHRAFLDDEFERFGTRLFALDDWGDDTHEGELLKYLKGWVSKGERLKTAERTRRGRKRKAREGKIVAPRKVAYGFAMNEARDAYVVDEQKMAIVRRVFDQVAEGASLHAVKKLLEAEGVLAPSGSSQWSRSTLRGIIKADLYFPHAFEEVASLVSPAVAAKLDQSVTYGIWWSSRYDIKVLGRKRTAEGGYVERYSHGLKQREEWIAVPVPDAGIPRVVAERARRNIEYNFRRTSKGSRIWELTGGLLYCGECGRRMATNTIAPAGRKKTYHYYLCPRKVEESWSICSNKNHRAEALEERVREAVSHLFRDPQAIEEQVERRMERERALMRDPEREALNWAKRLAEIATKRGRYQDQQAAGLMTLEELRERLGQLDEEREAAKRGLEAASDRKARIEALENDLAIVLALYGAYAGADLSLFPPEERRRIYTALGLKASAYSDGRVEIEIAGQPAGGFFPPEEETREFVERIIYDPEKAKWREEWRERFERLLSKDDTQRKGGVMSCDGSSSPFITSTRT